MISSELQDLRSEFIDLSCEFAKKLSTPTSKVDARDVIVALEKTICDEEAFWLLRSRNYGAESMIDSYWTSKHEYAKQRVVEKLVNRLHDLRLPTEIATESQGPNARHDILLTVKKPDGSVKKRVALEIKTGYRLDFSQLERLMRDSDVVVLIRAETGHVTTLRSRRYDALLTGTLRDRIGRLRRLVEGRAYAIQGRGCFMCANLSCPSKRRSTRSNRFTLTNDHFDVDLDAFLRTLPLAIDKAVESVASQISDSKS